MTDTRDYQTRKRIYQIFKQKKAVERVGLAKISQIEFQSGRNSLANPQSSKLSDTTSAGLCELRQQSTQIAPEVGVSFVI